MATKTIKMTDTRQGNSFRTGLNGKYYDLPLNQAVKVDAALADHLTSIGAAFDEVDAKGASASKEGSGDVLAPTPSGAHDVVMTGTKVKSLNDRPLAGDQPGDVTGSGGVQFADADHHGSALTEDTKAADARVAAERVAKEDASAAELAGEGEGGTPKAKVQAAAKTDKK